MFVEKEIRNFTLSNGSSVQIVVDSPFFYVYVNGTRFRTNEQPASYSGSYLSSYLHRNLGIDDRVQVKYKNYYCSLFMPDKKKRVEIEVTPLEENHIYVTARVNNATVYRKMEQKLVRLFRDIQDLEIYRQLRTEYLNCVRQHNFLSFNTEKIASMFDYELVQVFRKSYETLREANEPYKEYMKNILRLMYEDSCKRGFSQLVGQPSNTRVIKYDVDVPDIKVSSVASNRDTKISPVANNKDVVSSMPDEKKSDDIDDDTNKDKYPLKRDKKPSFADDRKVISFEEYKRLRANGVKVDYTHYKVEYKSHEEYEERVRLLYEDHMKLNAERHRQELSQAVEQPIDTGVVKHDIDVPDIKASSDEDFGDDYASDEDYGDYSSEEDRNGASSDDNEEENLGDYSADGDEDYGDYDSDDEDYGDGYFSDSDDKNYSSEEDVSDDDYSSDDEDYGDDYASDKDRVEDLGEEHSLEANDIEDTYVSDDNDYSSDSDADYSSDDSEDYGDYSPDDEDLSDEDSGIEDDYGDYSSDDDEDYGDYASDDDYADYSADDEEDYGDGYDSDDEDFGDNYGN